MVSVLIILSAILMVDGIYARCSVKRNPIKREPVTDECINCICYASTGCDTTRKCDGDVCGSLAITKPYWIDAGKPTLPGISPDSPDAYSTCSNNPQCAARTVRGYMKNLGQDCNNDGIIDCYDYMAIHKLGGYGCTVDLPCQYVDDFKACIAEKTKKPCNISKKNKYFDIVQMIDY